MGAVTRIFDIKKNETGARPTNGISIEFDRNIVGTVASGLAGDAYSVTEVCHHLFSECLAVTKPSPEAMLTHWQLGW